MTAMITAAVLLLAGDPAPAQRSEEARMQDIIAALHKWRDSIRSVRIKCEWRWEYPEGSREAAQLQGHEYVNGVDWIWTTDGRGRRYEWTRDHGRLVRDTLLTSNGEKGYIIENPGGDPPAKIERVKLWYGDAAHAWVPPLNSARHFLGRGHIKSLGDPLRQQEPNRYRAELFDDQETVRLKITLTSLTMLRQIGWLALDPERQFWPRVVETLSVKETVDEFRYVDPPGIWFPIRGTSTVWQKGKIYQHERWRVTALEVNGPLDPSLFSPTIPEGAIIVDPPYEPGKKTKNVDQKQLWLAWLVGAAVAAACVWMIVRAWKQLRWRE